jgi:hypothetical protein
LLGLSTEHRGLLITSHVALVYQIAASVPFQDTLLGTTKTNALQRLRWCDCVEILQRVIAAAVDEIIGAV